MDKITDGSAASRPRWATLETDARGEIQPFVRRRLEAEVEALLGRRKSERRAATQAPPGSRTGYGKPRQLALASGTMTVRRPRARDLAARFVSRVLPLFQRRTEAVGTWLPERYLHGLALGDFELALRAWQTQYAAWRQRDLGELALVYLWADGLYVKKAGLEDTKTALLVLVRALADGRKVGGEAVQASGERDGPDLEGPARGGAALPPAQRPAPVRGGLRRDHVLGRQACRYPAPNVCCRLTPFTHFLTRPHPHEANPSTRSECLLAQ